MSYLYHSSSTPSVNKGQLLITATRKMGSQRIAPPAGSTLAVLSVMEGAALTAGSATITVTTMTDNDNN